MQRTFLRAKLHRVHVTHAELHYEGSIAIDGALLDAADLRPYERVEIYNVSNGERFATYAVRAQEHSGTVLVMGAAAHCARPGDTIIVCAYVELEPVEWVGFKPRLVYVDEHNRIQTRPKVVSLPVGA